MNEQTPQTVAPLPVAREQRALTPGGDVQVTNMFQTLQAFELSQRMALALAKCELLPEAYRNNPSNCLVLLDVSSRLGGYSPFWVAQQLVPVKGKYGWQGQGVITLINNSRMFKDRLKFEFSGQGDDYGCTAWAIDQNGEKVLGTKITRAMVKAEGWSEDSKTKSGYTIKSKWGTMEEQMFMYRAASFFGRVHCPEVLHGYHSVEEIEDTEALKDVTPFEPTAKTSEIMSKFGQGAEDLTPPAPPENPNPSLVVEPKRPRAKVHSEALPATPVDGADLLALQEAAEAAANKTTEQGNDHEDR